MCGERIPEIVRLCRTASSLLKSGSALQSANVGAPVSDSVLRESLEQHLRVEEARLAEQEGRPPSDRLPAQVAQDLLAAGRNVLKRFENGESAGSLSDFEFNALQAIIQVTGRPALKYLDGLVQLPTTAVAENQYWHVFIAVARKQIDGVSRSVGRLGIERPGVEPEIIGTAWRLGDDLLVTNRHVAGRLVIPGVRDSSLWKLDDTRTAFIDFAATEGKPATSRFLIGSLVYCAPEPFVDLAVLRLERRGEIVPGGLALDMDSEALGRTVEENGDAQFAGAEVYVVGHPFREDSSPQIDRVFGRADGNKRCSPGYVTSISCQNPILEHDCSTLGGNSGSCVVSRARHGVVGIHFGSRGTDEVTGVADTNLAVALTQLGRHPALQILQTGRVGGTS